MEPVFTVEAGLPWDPHAFNSLNVSDKFLKNGKGDQAEYQLIPLPTGGLSRHLEAFTQQDCWVTLYNWTEMSARDLLSYITPP